MNIDLRNSRTLLTKSSGFLSEYTHSLNPYIGCAFACSYCYVKQMPIARFRGQSWGSWVDVKINAKQLLRKELDKLQKKEERVTLFMSSSTDPYQPLEQKYQITRGLLETMLDSPPDFLFIQTRSPLILRDKAILKEMSSFIRVSITIETDDDAVRKRFSPYAPPIQARLHTLNQLTEQGIPTQAAVSPLLPSTPHFAAKLSKVTNRLCIDDYFQGDGANGKRTARMRIDRLYRQDEATKWYHPDAIYHFREQCLQYFSQMQIKMNKEGFRPN